MSCRAIPRIGVSDTGSVRYTVSDYLSVLIFNPVQSSIHESSFF